MYRKYDLCRTFKLLYIFPVIYVFFYRKNVGWASTCNSVGQTTGYFLGNVVFLALESAEFCNKYLRFEPQPDGIVTLAGLLYISKSKQTGFKNPAILIRQDNTVYRISICIGQDKSKLQKQISNSLILIEMVAITEICVALVCAVLCLFVFLMLMVEAHCPGHTLQLSSRLENDC